MTRLLTSDPVVAAIDQENNRLLAENDALRERVRQLEEMLGCGFRAPREWGLTAREERFLGLLVARPFVAHEVAKAFLFTDSEALHVDAMLRIYVSRLRRKIAVAGGKIILIWGRGYELDGAMRTMLTPRAEHRRIGAT